MFKTPFHWIPILKQVAKLPANAADVNLIKLLLNQHLWLSLNNY